MNIYNESMKKIILSLVGVVGLTAGLYAQPANTVTLTNMGGFNNTFTYSHTENFTGPLLDMPAGAVTYTYLAGPDVIGGKKYQMVLCVPPGVSQPFLMYLVDRDAPWMENGKIEFNSDGTVNRSSGYATSLDYSGFAVSWDGGGFGPGYSSGGGGGAGEGSGGVIVEQASQLNVGLTFQNGQWTPTQ